MEFDGALRRAAQLFVSGDAGSLTLLSKSERENDFRAAAVLEEDGVRTVVKIASNAFTTPRRIEGWENLIRESHALGAYMPALIPSLSGRLSEEFEFDGKIFTAWREEFAPYPLAQTDEEFGMDAYKQKDAARPKSEDGSPAWQGELIALYAKLAAARLPGGWGMSGYVRLVPFDGEETDEVEECAVKLGAEIESRFPALLPRWRETYGKWKANRDALAALYSRLPTSVFQADANDTNVLLTEDGHFAGLIDCNLAGEDTALNAALTLGYVGFAGDDPLTDEERAKKALRIFARERAWNADETAAAPILWKYITALYWSEVGDIQNADTGEKAAAVLDRIDRALEAEVSFEPYMRSATLK